MRKKINHKQYVVFYEILGEWMFSGVSHGFQINGEKVPFRKNLCGAKFLQNVVDIRETIWCDFICFLKTFSFWKDLKWDGMKLKHFSAEI